MENWWKNKEQHYSDLTMSTMTSQITSISTVCSVICSGKLQRKHQSSASLAFLRGINQWLVDSPNGGPVTRKMFPLDDVIMALLGRHCLGYYLGTLPCGHVSAIHLKIRNPYIFILLTLYVLFFSERTETYIYIWSHSSTLIRLS